MTNWTNSPSVNGPYVFPIGRLDNSFEGLDEEDEKFKKLVQLKNIHCHGDKKCVVLLVQAGWLYMLLVLKMAIVSFAIEQLKLN